MENQTIPQENKMGVMPIDRLLLSMSLPMMISMLVQALYNIVDSIFVSRINEYALRKRNLHKDTDARSTADGQVSGSIRIYRVGIPSIIMQAIGSVMTYGMNLILEAFGTAQTVFGIYFKLQSFILSEIRFPPQYSTLQSRNSNR